MELGLSGLIICATCYSGIKRTFRSSGGEPGAKNELFSFYISISLSLYLYIYVGLCDPPFSVHFHKCSLQPRCSVFPAGRIPLVSGQRRELGAVSARRPWSRRGPARPGPWGRPTAAMAGGARRLYRRLLRLHRSLPPALRDLGDRYVKEEFRRHKAAEPAEAQRFLREWEASVRRPAGQGRGRERP